MTTKPDCDAMRKSGIAAHDAGKFELAIAQYREGLAACGEGHGFHNELGFSLATQGQNDAAAVEYLAELRGPKPPTTTFGNLFLILGKLSPGRRTEIATLGTTEDAPIRVPEISMEYGWVEKAACPNGAGKASTQALINTKHGQLDALMFTCPGDSTEHRAYFDFSDDPSEKAMREELGK
jgi:hypothetical protein